MIRLKKVDKNIRFTRVTCAVVALSLASVVGLTFLVLSCALPTFKFIFLFISDYLIFRGNWWPIFVLVFYILSPLPISLAKHFRYDVGPTSPTIELAVFGTTGIVLSAFALPFVLAHVGVIKWTAFMLSSIGSVSIFSTIFAYFLMQNVEENGGWGTSMI
ncbi:unnamed protein product [Meloidogyne enterolobii]|uniref:Uncharacterized protein n=1 Tax=Meloidogyne enterolobii TaxID=390850 RepID=A0ACB0YDK7_MELEN